MLWLLSGIMVCLCVRIYFPLPCVCVCLFLNKKKKKKKTYFYLVALIEKENESFMYTTPMTLINSFEVTRTCLYPSWIFFYPCVGFFLPLCRSNVAAVCSFSLPFVGLPATCRSMWILWLLWWSWRDSRYWGYSWWFSRLSLWRD